ncbi:MAG: glutathione S-transferase family protein [Pseudomonadota bacterium]
MYKIVGSPKTRAFRVLWTLEELGLDYEIDPTGPHKEPIDTINPSGKIPAFYDGDEVIIDSVAISQYLADKHGALTFAAGTIERAQQDSFTQFAMDDVENALWTAAKNSFILPEDVRVPAIIDVCKMEFQKAMDVFEERLGERKFVMGDAFTVADIFIVHCLNWARNSDFPTPDGTIAAYADRVRARDGYQRAWERREAT